MTNLRRTASVAVALVLPVRLPAASRTSSTPSRVYAIAGLAPESAAGFSVRPTVISSPSAAPAAVTV